MISAMYIKMPYKLRKARNKDLYWVVDSTGDKYSNKPIPLARAKKQITALHINTGHGLSGGMKEKVEEAIQYISGKPTPEGITSRFMEIVGSPLFSHEEYAKNIEAYKQFYFKNAVIARDNFDDMEDAIRSYPPGHIFTPSELRHLKIQLTAILQQFSDKPKWRGGISNQNNPHQLFEQLWHQLAAGIIAPNVEHTLYQGVQNVGMQDFALYVNFMRPRDYNQFLQNFMNQVNGNANLDHGLLAEVAELLFDMTDPAFVHPGGVHGGALNANVAKAIELFDRGFHEDIVRMSLQLYMDNATAQQIDAVITQAKQIIAQRLQGGGDEGYDEELAMYSEPSIYERRELEEQQRQAVQAMIEAERQRKSKKKPVKRRGEKFKPTLEPIEEVDMYGGAMATVDIMQKMAVQSYKPNATSVGNWDLVAETPTLKFFKSGDSFIVAIRGTHPSNFNDLKADASIAFNRLEYSQRYKIDKADLKKFIAGNPGTYYGTGHSLGGAILDLFIREGMINEGISFNPAIQPRDYQSDSYLKNKRIYESCDPLYKTMGRFAKGSQANTNAKGNILECHSLSNFDSITGGKKLKHIKKYLKGMGIPATKKNIDHAMSACDAEGVVF